MQKQFFLVLILILLAGCAPAAAPTPTPTSTHTPLPPTETPIPTPKVETGPEGTVVTKDYLDNKYTVDENGVPAYWWNSEANDGKGEWEKFQPINFTGEYVSNDSELPVIPNIIYITSGYMEHVVTEAGLPENPDAYYMRSTKDWEDFYLDNFDDTGLRRTQLETDRFQDGTLPANAKFYPIQPTNYDFLLNYNGETYKVLTHSLNIQTTEGKKQIPLFFYFPESIYVKSFSDTSDRALFQRMNFHEFVEIAEFMQAIVPLPIIDYDFKKREERQLFPQQIDVYKIFTEFYNKDAQMSFFKQRKILLDRLIRGDQEAARQLARYLFAPSMAQMPFTP